MNCLFVCFSFRFTEDAVENCSPKPFRKFFKKQVKPVKSYVVFNLVLKIEQNVIFLQTFWLQRHTYLPNKNKWTCYDYFILAKCASSLSYVYYLKLEPANVYPKNN